VGNKCRQYAQSDPASYIQARDSFSPRLTLRQLIRCKSHAAGNQQGKEKEDRFHHGGGNGREEGKVRRASQSPPKDREVNIRVCILTSCQTEKHQYLGSNQTTNESRWYSRATWLVPHALCVEKRTLCWTDDKGVAVSVVVVATKKTAWLNRISRVSAAA
jgi:hypothetical protein